MLKIETTVLPSLEQWEIIIEAVRTAAKVTIPSDSYEKYTFDPDGFFYEESKFVIGENDLKLLKDLSMLGGGYDSYLGMITVYVTISASPDGWNAVLPLRWMTEVQSGIFETTKTFAINYLAILEIYNWCKTHSEPECKTLLEWIEHLPYSELFIVKAEHCDRGPNVEAVAPCFD